MIKKVDLGTSSLHHGVFGDPAPLGLIGLAISCAALTPMAFGYIPEDPKGFITVATFVLCFGFGTHLITGIMDFSNKNAFGGTIFSAFAFNWLVSAITNYGIAFGYMPDHYALAATEVVMLVIFIFLTYGFGFFSTALFLFLLDIDLLFICKVGKAFTHSHAFDMPIAIFTVFLGLIGLWLALGGLLNPVSRKEIFKMGKPVFKADKKKGFDFSVRVNISGILFEQWKENAFREMPVEELEKKVKEKTGAENITPDLFYLMEYGTIHMTLDEKDRNIIKSVRLTAGGIDLHEQLVLKKYEF